MRNSYTWRWNKWFFKYKTYQFFWLAIWVYGKIVKKDYPRNKYEKEEPGTFQESK